MVMTDNYCFSILALSRKYQALTKAFAEDLARYSPGTKVVVGTDNPAFFSDSPNVIAFGLERQGILTCYNDKRFVIGEALTRFGTVVQIDADTKICGVLPTLPIAPSPGVVAIHIENMVEHTQKYNPERMVYLHKLAEKLDIDIDSVRYVGESLFSICADAEQGTEFVYQWDLIARYMELHGIHAGEGNAIGLAAAKTGLDVYKAPWLESIDKNRKHLDSSIEMGDILSKDLMGRLQYHYRLNQARINALGNFKFYYQ
jgi:hypothetical protein